MRVLIEQLILMRHMVSNTNTGARTAIRSQRRGLTSIETVMTVMTPAFSPRAIRTANPLSDPIDR
jgi:hypothetical protein